MGNSVTKKPAMVPSHIREKFVVALTNWPDVAQKLPDPLTLDTVVHVIEDPAECLADERTARGVLRVRAGNENENGFFLDYYYEAAGFSFTVHSRVHEDGSTEPLDNYEGLFSRRVFDDPEETERERQRIIEHNARVREILRAKGFTS